MHNFVFCLGSQWVASPCTKAGLAISIAFLTSIYLNTSYRSPALMMPQNLFQCLIWVIQMWAQCLSDVENNRHTLALWLQDTGFAELLAIKIWGIFMFGMICLFFFSPWVCNQYMCSIKRINTVPKYISNCAFYIIFFCRGCLIA